MKVKDVEIFDVRPENLEGITDNARPIIVRINTDHGISGIGEAAMAYGSQDATLGMIKYLAESFIIGVNPLDIEKIWMDIFHSAFWTKSGGVVIYGGISAIDIALWDIKGKAYGLPVYHLLGGKTRDKVRVYASQIQYGWDSGPAKCISTPEEYAQEAIKVVEEGYDAIKVNPIAFNKQGFYSGYHKGIVKNEFLENSYKRVKAIRDAVGPDIEIIIELHSNLGVTNAIKLCHYLEDLDIYFVEEPVHYLDYLLQKKVTENTFIPMAAGERLFTRWGFEPYITSQILNIIQPDLGIAGGITEVKKICDFADIYDIDVQLHVCGSPILTAAALQVEATIPNFFIHEHHTRNLKDGNNSICKNPYFPQKGSFVIPDEPGLGIELNEKVISQCKCIRITEKVVPYFKQNH